MNGTKSLKLPDRPDGHGATDKFVRSLGMTPELDLRNACADFYVLERLLASARPAARMLSSLEHSLAREFSAYLDMTVGGELRHALDFDQTGVVKPRGLTIYFKTLEALDIGNNERAWAWEVWTYLRSYYAPESVEWLDDAHVCFSRGWRSSAGGKKWAQVARVEYDWLRGRLKHRTFVDRCFTIQHNNGAVFDKVYPSTARLDKTLQIQADDDYNRLAGYASPRVRELWFSERRKERQSYSREWLGVQED